MAEFIEVMKKKNEMCEYHRSCFDCPLGKNTTDACYRFINKKPKEAEELIMDWAAPVDWAKVEVDTPIYVRNNRKSDDWMPRHFARYEEGLVYAWSNGATSFTAKPHEIAVGWAYAKLAEKEK